MQEQHVQRRGDVVAAIMTNYDFTLFVQVVRWEFPFVLDMGRCCFMQELHVRRRGDVAVVVWQIVTNRDPYRIKPFRVPSVLKVSCLLIAGAARATTM